MELSVFLKICSETALEGAKTENESGRFQYSQGIVAGNGSGENEKYIYIRGDQNLFPANSYD